MNEKIINVAALTDSSQPGFLLIPLWTISEESLNTVDGGSGNDFLVITGTPDGDNLLVSSPASLKIKVEKLGGTGSIIGTNFENLDIRAGDGADTINLDYIVGSGVKFISIDAGKNVIDTLQTQIVEDPDSDILVPDLLSADFSDKLDAGSLDDAWKQESAERAEWDNTLTDS